MLVLEESSGALSALLRGRRRESRAPRRHAARRAGYDCGSSPVALAPLVIVLGRVSVSGYGLDGQLLRTCFATVSADIARGHPA